MRLNRAEDVRSGKALTAEITGERWVSRLHYKFPIISPETAAKRLLRIASQNHFTAYEYFLTDHIGHWRRSEDKENILEIFDRFLFFILKNLDKEKMTLIICSDHGNFEDLSIKTHTLNPALTITGGRYGKELSESIEDLTHIKTAIMNLFR